MSKQIKHGFLLIVLLLIGLAAYGQLSKQSAVTAVFPKDLKYNSTPFLPKGIEVAQVFQEPAEKTNAAWILRVRYAANVKLMPHSHPDTRQITVLSGTYYQGTGERFDEKSLTAYPSGAFIIVPAGVKHFVWAKDDEAIVQESGTAPTGITYVDPAADPRNPTK